MDKQNRYNKSDMRIDKSNIHQYIQGNSLYCSKQGITSIEDIPDHITDINCDGNKLTQLPKLPDGLLYLDCDSNNLTSLPMLPDSLFELYCENNNLTSYSSDQHSGYPEDPSDKQWMLNHNKWLNRINIINKICE